MCVLCVECQKVSQVAEVVDFALDEKYMLEYNIGGSFNSKTQI